MVVFSSAVFYAEDSYVDNPMAMEFASIPRTFWWCLVTMTTVGYGDATPQTFWGRFIAIVTMFLGILILALPITVIGASFSGQFDRQIFESRIEKYCTVNEGGERVMDSTKLEVFLRDMDMRGNLKIPLPKTPQAVQDILDEFDVHKNNKLDRAELKALITEIVVDPSDFTGVTVQKLAREMHELRGQCPTERPPPAAKITHNISCIRAQARER